MAENDRLEALIRLHVGVAEALADLSPDGLVRHCPNGTALVITGTPVAAVNGIVSTDRHPDADEIDACAAALQWDGPWSIQVRGAADARVVATAALYGLTRASTQTFMVRWPEAAAPEAPQPAGFCLRPVTARDVGAYVRALAEGFGVPAEVFALMDDPAAVDMPGIGHYLAERHGTVVGTGMTVVEDDLVGLYNIAVLPPYRGQGHGRALTEALLAEGRAAGATTAFLVASASAGPFYEAVGFRAEDTLMFLMGE